jgi:predicted outer membrane repeat protein
MKRIFIIPGIIAVITFFPIIILAAIIHVPADQPTIQAGIDTAVDGDTVLVADGTYTGDRNRDIDFNGKVITVMSESGAENCVVDCEGTEQENHRGFYFHNNENENSVVRGFTLRNGYMTAYPDYNGSGIYCVSSSPTVADSVFTKNTAVQGAGICCSNSSSPVVNCIFTENTAFGGGGLTCINSNPMITYCKFLRNVASAVTTDCTFLSSIEDPLYGGGIYSIFSTPIITNCDFTSNSTGNIGGGIYFYDTSAIITNCSFTDNKADNYGGGIHCSESFPTITNSIFAENNAVRFGGGIECFDSSPIITNCIFTANKAKWGGGISCYSRCDPIIKNCTFTKNLAKSTGGGIFFKANFFLTVTSCIFANDIRDEIFMQNGVLKATFSCIQGGYAETGNIDVDPHFVSGPLGDYYLSQRTSGQSSDSQCVDSGSDLAANISFETLDGPVFMSELWTRTDGITDSGQVDMGCHYPVPDIPLKTGVKIWMPSHQFFPGDACSCKVTVCNVTGVSLSNYPLFVILSAFDNYYFAPSFTSYDNYLNQYPSFSIGETEIIVLPEFQWPSGVGNASGLTWYAALTDPAITQLFGEMESWEFGWSE